MRNWTPPQELFYALKCRDKYAKRAQRKRGLLGRGTVATACGLRGCIGTSARAERESLCFNVHLSLLWGLWEAFTQLHV